MSVLGIDVSHWNGRVDWPAVGRSEARFAFAKATDGNRFVDSEFARSWPAIRDAGLLRGAYHFGRPGSDPEVQAAHFASVVGELSWGELPPVLDLETMDGQPKKAVIDWTLAFVARAEALFGCPLVIYTGGLWRREMGAPDVRELGSRLLWTARYGSKEPVVPRPWKRWSFWQFTDGQSGKVQDIPGVSGPCDCNRWRGTFAELEALSDRIGGTAVPAAPVVVPRGKKWPGRLLIWPSHPTVRGKDVTVWQRRMARRRFTVKVDGIYGAESKAACLAFQREVGLEPDGIVGRKTWDATFDDKIV